MKKVFTVTAFIAFAFVSCFNGKGNLTGNVYYKFNDYVGNKPDVGARVYLIKNSIDKEVIETDTDVAGNYKLENIKSGEYFLIVVSNNTTDKPFNSIKNLVQYRENLKYLNLDLGKIDNKLYDDFISKHYDYEYKKINARNEDQNKKANDSLDIALENLESTTLKIIELENFKKVANKLTIAKNISRKIEAQKISIKNGETLNINTDFGVTYL